MDETDHNPDRNRKVLYFFYNNIFMMTMLKIYENHPYTVIVMPDHIDLYNASDLKKSLFPLAEEKDFVAIDFSQVKVIDSSGLGVLAVLSKRMASMDKFLGVYGIPDNIYQIMKITAADKYFNIFLTLEELKRS